MKAINLVCGTLHPRCFQHFNYLTIQAHVVHNTIYRMCDALALVQITWFIWPRMLYSHVFKISTHIPHYHITYHAFKREDEGKPHYQASITCTICVACTFCPTSTAAVALHCWYYKVTRELSSILHKHSPYGLCLFIKIDKSSDLSIILPITVAIVVLYA